MKEIFLSLIIPAYNEKFRLQINLQLVYDYLKNQNYNFEIIVVDDGSFDGTQEIVKEYQKSQDSLRLIQNSKNRGKGYAVKTGMQQAKGDTLVFMDADLSVPLENISWLVNYISDGFDIVISSRNIQGALIKLKQPLVRRLMGKVFLNLSKLALRINVSDITCGAKSFSRVAADKIFSKMRLNDWSFDAEILFLARKYNFKIKEIPVVWKNRHASKVRFPRDIFQSFLGLMKIKLFDLLGYYDRK